MPDIPLLVADDLPGLLLCQKCLAADLQSKATSCRQEEVGRSGVGCEQGPYEAGVLSIRVLALVGFPV